MVFSDIIAMLWAPISENTVNKTKKSLFVKVINVWKYLIKEEGFLLALYLLALIVFALSASVWLRNVKF